MGVLLRLFMKLFYHPERNINNNKNEDSHRTNNNNNLNCDNYDNEIILFLIDIHQIINDDNITMHSKNKGIITFFLK